MATTGALKRHRLIVLVNDDENAKFRQLAAKAGLTPGELAYGIVARALGR